MIPLTQSSVAHILDLPLWWRQRGPWLCEWKWACGCWKCNMHIIKSLRYLCVFQLKFINEFESKFHLWFCVRLCIIATLSVSWNENENVAQKPLQLLFVYAPVGIVMMQLRVVCLWRATFNIRLFKTWKATQTVSRVVFEPSSWFTHVSESLHLRFEYYVPCDARAEQKRQ